MFGSLPQHPDDALFICVEPDACFTKADGEHLARLAEEVGEPSTAMMEQRIADQIANLDWDHPDKSSMEREFKVWRAVKQKQANARWPTAETASKHSSAATPAKYVPPKLPPWREAKASQGAQGRPSGVEVDVDVVAPRAPKVRASDLDPENVSFYLQDLVDTFNWGAKHGITDCLWCGWNADQWRHGRKRAKNKDMPSAGTHMIIFSAKGCRKLMPLMQNSPDMHMGSFMKMMVLQKWTKPPYNVGAGFVSPPMCGFYTHGSTTCDGRTLEDHWNDNWTQEGT